MVGGTILTVNETYKKKKKIPSWLFSTAKH
jgi:hypothetical protein